MKKADGAKSKEGEGRKVMTYRNNNKRVIRLAELGLIDEIRSGAPNTVNLHGRKDYKVTRKGLEQLLPHVITHPDDVKGITEYNPAFGEMLVTKMTPMIKSTNGYLKSVVHLQPLPIEADEVTQLQRSTLELYIRLKTLQSEIVARSRRRLLAQQRVVKSTVQTEHINTGGRDIEITHIMSSKDLVDFERQLELERQRLSASSSSSGSNQPKKSIPPLQRKKH